jgi:hypothetical protein
LSCEWRVSSPVVALIGKENLTTVLEHKGGEMIRKTFTLVGLSAILIATLTPAKNSIAQNLVKESQQVVNANDLAGTWLTKITPPPEGPPAFAGIFSFASGGSLVATQAGGEFPALGNPQLGLWSRAAGGKGQFTITYYGQDFDDQFQLTDTYRVRGTVKLDSAGNSFSGQVDITVYDLDGNEVFSDCCAMIEGTRGALSAPDSPANPYYVTPNRKAGWSRRPSKS